MLAILLFYILQKGSLGRCSSHHFGNPNTEVRLTAILQGIVNYYAS
jgi:hypothetical protein